LATFGRFDFGGWVWNTSALFEDTPWESLYGRAPQPLATGGTSSVFEGWVKAHPEQRVAIKILRFESSQVRVTAALTALARGALRDAAAECGGGALPAAAPAPAPATPEVNDWVALLAKGCHEVAALRCAALVNKRVREAGQSPRLHEFVSAHCEAAAAGKPRALVIVTKFANCGDLLSSLWRANVRVMDGATLLREAFLGVADLHEAGLVHNDVKPGNILVHRDAAGAMHAMVADLGSVRLPGLRAGSLQEGPFDPLGGTEEYLAPEVDVDIPGGPPRDVFALGVLLAVALTGGPPAVEHAIASDPAFGPVDRRNLGAHPATYRTPDHTKWTNAKADEALGLDGGRIVGDLWERHAGGGLPQLLRRMLEADPGARAPLTEALDHPWWTAALADGRALAVEAVGAGGGASFTPAADSAGARSPAYGGASAHGGAGFFPMSPTRGGAALGAGAGAGASAGAAAASPAAPPRPQLPTLLYGRALHSRSSSEEVAKMDQAFRWRQHMYRLRVTLDAVAAQMEGYPGAGVCNDEGVPACLSSKTGTYYCGRRGRGADFFWNGCGACAADGGRCGKATLNGVLGCECHSCHRLTVLAAAAAGDVGNARRSANWPGTFRLCSPQPLPPLGAPTRGIRQQEQQQRHHHHRGKRPRSPEKNGAGRAVKEHGGHFFCGAEVGPAGLWVGWLPGWAPGAEVRCRPSTRANCTACHVVDVMNLRGAVGAALLPALPPAPPPQTPLPVGALVKTAPPRAYGDGFLGVVVHRRLGGGGAAASGGGEGEVRVRVLRRAGGAQKPAFAPWGALPAPAPALAAPRALALAWVGTAQEEKVEEETWMGEAEVMRADLLPPPLVLVNPRRSPDGGGSGSHSDGGSSGGGGGGGGGISVTGVPAGAPPPPPQLEQLGETLARAVREKFLSLAGRGPKGAGSAGVTKAQLGELLKDVGLTGARYDHAALFDLLDQEDSGLVDLREILLGLAHLVSFRASEHTLLSLLFFAFDLDGDGVLSKDELGQLLAAFGAPPATVDAVERARRGGMDLNAQRSSLARYAVALFDKMDVDHDGNGEFARARHRCHNTQPQPTPSPHAQKPPHRAVTLKEFTLHVTKDPVMRALWVERDEAGAMSLLSALAGDAERGLQELRVAMRAKEARVLILEREMARLAEAKEALLAERELLKLKAAREVERLPAHDSGACCEGCGSSPIRGHLWRCEPCAFILCGRCREDSALARAWDVRCSRGHCYSRWAGGGRGAGGGAGGGEGAAPASAWARAWGGAALSKLLSPARAACGGVMHGGEGCDGAVEWGCGLCAAYRCGDCFASERAAALVGREEELLASESLLVRALSDGALCLRQHPLVGAAPPPPEEDAMK
jgi:serine/threonine protein kinase/Ca2+-binding EF-hand superfamily protein/uncharacterized membrane protein YgcG